jgi:hypothetical protein
MTEAQLLPVIWTLASMTVAVLSMLLISPARLAQLRLSVGGRFLEHFLRLLYFVGIPYAALLTRAIAPIDMGLSGSGGPLLGWTAAEWLRGLGTALTIGVLVLIPIGWASRQIARAGLPLSADERSVGAVIVEAIYSEFHWTFYRAAPLILLADVYGAVLVGVVLVGTEWLVMLMRNGLSSMAAERQLWLRRIIFLAMSAALFILTQNAWLAIGLHLASEIMLKAWLAHLTRRAEPVMVETLQQTSRELARDPDVRPLNERPSA